MTAIGHNRTATTVSLWASYLVCNRAIYLGTDFGAAITIAASFRQTFSMSIG
jgi:hypothetical protein